MVCIRSGSALQDSSCSSLTGKVSQRKLTHSTRKKRRSGGNSVRWPPRRAGRQQPLWRGVQAHLGVGSGRRLRHLGGHGRRAPGPRHAA